MKTNEVMNLYDKTWKKYGSAMQFIVAMEECSELIKALSKFMRKCDSEDFKSIVEEIADVEIMIEQIKWHFNVGIFVDILKNQKLERLEQRLKEGEENEQKDDSK